MTRRRRHAAIGVGLSAIITIVASSSSATESVTYTYDALGRLVVAQSAGTVNDDQAHSLCFDPAGNRTKYYSDDATGIASCAPTPAPMPTPSPPASSSNTPPVAVQDSGYVNFINQPTLFNLVANDTDADGDYPLVLTSASVTSGYGTVSLISPTQVSVERKYSWSTNMTISYQITDGRGAVSTGQLLVTCQQYIC